MEPRRLLAVVSWTGGADNSTWERGGNWSTGQVPTDGDDVIIDVQGNANVRIFRDTALLNSLLNRETITLTGNTFTISSSILVGTGRLDNYGTIVMTSGGIGHESEISPFFDAVIQNHAGAVIRTEAGQGGSRTIGGPLGLFINDGTIDANVESRLEGPVLNRSLIDAADAPRFVFTQSDTVLAPGTTLLGQFEQFAGSIHVTTETGNFTVALEANVDFLGNASPGVTLNARGSSFTLAARLQVPDGTVNRGTLNLTSINGSWEASIFAGGTLINHGTIRAQVGTGGARRIEIDGNLEGTGSVELNQNSARLTTGRILQSRVSAVNNTTVTLRTSDSDSATSKAQFDFAPFSLFQINDNAVIFDYSGASPIATIRSMLLAGYNNGFWNDPNGINTDFGRPDLGLTIGYSEATDAGAAGGTFVGVAVDATAVLVRQTVHGDTNLDRRVDFADLLRFSGNYRTGPGVGWSRGDFDYDGSNAFADLLLLAAQYRASYPGNPQLRRGASDVLG